MNIPLFQLNLDDPPNERWITIIPLYKDKLKTLCKYLKTTPNYTILYRFLAKYLSIPSEYLAEIHSISKILNEPFEVILYFQLLWGLNLRFVTGFCETDSRFIQFQLLNVSPKILNILRSLVIHIQFHRCEKYFCKAYGFIGLVGILGYVNHNYSLCLHLPSNSYHSLFKLFTCKSQIPSLALRSLAEHKYNNITNIRYLIQQRQLGNICHLFLLYHQDTTYLIYKKNSKVEKDRQDCIIYVDKKVQIPSSFVNFPQTIQKFASGCTVYCNEMYNKNQLHGKIGR